MKQFIAYLLLILLLSDCKKSAVDPETLPEIKNIAGKWRSDSYERTINGKKVWEKVTANYIIFRFDGVLLENNGLPACCTPESYNINGKPFQIVPKTPLDHNPQCDLIDCIICESWDIEQIDNEMIITYCIMGGRIKYVRE
ncbi:hypothetical protein [Dyadobacter sp. NIV53]|uniref:hypothetical protein n=1 Tax=Dyadobacter sp. NIV53 TaxID=2861765 RepID=UPI001C889457|nr:hypothetical protein [Dyadobacter sp. NIV53]